MPDVKVTITIPEECRDQLVAVGSLLRSDPGFRQTLGAFIEEAQRPTLTALLTGISQRLDRLEMRLDDMGADLQAVSEGEYIGPDPDWTTGQGAGKRLTPAGDAELVRLIDRGLSDADIGKRMELSALVIRRRRRRYEFERSAQSE
ncbi:TPA: hypothetical protein VMX41_001784 [Streptococcus pyogenes]|nr:hypothetical protein [Streptococcus pyogenes]